MSQNGSHSLLWPSMKLQMQHQRCCNQGPHQPVPSSQSDQADHVLPSGNQGLQGYAPCCIPLLLDINVPGLQCNVMAWNIFTMHEIAWLSWLGLREEVHAAKSCNRCSIQPWRKGLWCLHTCTSRGWFQSVWQGVQQHQRFSIRGYHKLFPDESAPNGSRHHRMRVRISQPSISLPERSASVYFHDA